MPQEWQRDDEEEERKGGSAECAERERGRERELKKRREQAG